MNRWFVYFYILLIFLGTGFYLFGRGERFGVEQYKHSKNFQMALDSMYHFGYLEGRNGK